MSGSRAAAVVDLNSNFYQFFASCGDGMEIFAQKAIENCCTTMMQTKPTVSAQVMRGCVVFLVSTSELLSFVSKVMRSELKCIERLFVSVLVQDQPIPSDRYQLLKILFDLIKDSSVWHRAFKVWSAFHSAGDDDGNPPDAKRFKLENRDGNRSNSCYACDFRVNCRCLGRWRKSVDNSRLAAQIGTRLTETMPDWRVDLRNPQLEVCIRLSDDRIQVGLPVSAAPISKRSGYVLHEGLRSTVSDALVQLCFMGDSSDTTNCDGGGLLFLDPMCGKGMLLVETFAQSMTVFGCGQNVIVGSDLQSDKLALTKENMEFAASRTALLQSTDCFSRKSTIFGGLVQAKANLSPFRDHLFDRILCDLPFGQQCLSRSEVDQLYPALFVELCRILRPNVGRLIILTGNALEQLVKDCAAETQLEVFQPSDFSIAFPHQIKMGLTEASILMFKNVAN